MKCSRWTQEIVECARTGSEPAGELQRHLGACLDCKERWQNERSLTLQLRVLRDAAGLRRSSTARRDRIMREFAMARRHSVHPSLKWALAAAAILLLTFGLAYALKDALHPRAGHPGPIVARKPMVARETAPEIEVGTADENGFVAVPYAPPLAAGEFVSVIRTELEPEALARMGIFVDAASWGDVPADVITGEDGLPRAVRLIEGIEF